MGLQGLIPLLRHAEGNGYALGGFVFANAETAQAIVETGSALRSPVLLMIGPWEIPVLRPRMIAAMAKALASQADVPVCLHLDHAGDIELVEECLGAGFPSVMMDGSRHDFEENVRLTRLVVEMAHAKGVSVEGELGAVGRVDDSSVEGAPEASLTDPGQAAEFVQRTGVDALAVAIGNAHGIYERRPVLDFERLRAIRKAVSVPLVLHGGSGTPPDQLREAIDIGISKVNVASELSRAFLDAIEDSPARRGGKAWFGFALQDAKGAVAQVVERWMRVLGSAGRVA
jgi:ketose-bisphosphate aldolase